MHGYCHEHEYNLQHKPEFKRERGDDKTCQQQQQ
jgi:hypothetical protein